MNESSVFEPLDKQTKSVVNKVTQRNETIPAIVILALKIFIILFLKET